MFNFIFVLISIAEDARKGYHHRQTKVNQTKSEFGISCDKHLKNNRLLLSDCTRLVSKLFLWLCFSSCPGRISSNYKNTKETKPNNTIAVFDTKAKPREVKVRNNFSKIRAVDIMTELAEHFA